MTSNAPQDLPPQGSLAAFSNQLPVYSDRALLDVSRDLMTEADMAEYNRNNGLLTTGFCLMALTGVQLAADTVSRQSPTGMGTIDSLLVAGGLAYTGVLAVQQGIDTYRKHLSMKFAEAKVRLLQGEVSQRLAAPPAYEL